MSTSEEGNVAYVTAHRDVRNDEPAVDNGFVGKVVKQATPPADGPRADRNLVKTGEAYILRLTGVIEIAKSTISAATKGQLVYIKTTDHTYALAAGTDFVPLGRVSSLAGERGTPLDKLRVNLNVKA
jgi:hypothetical protein